MGDSSEGNRATSTDNVHFVNATVANPSAPKDPAMRAIIRKQAMKKAADTRRRGGNHGKYNLRQYPVFYKEVGDDGEAEEVIDQEEYDSRSGQAGGSSISEWQQQQQQQQQQQVRQQPGSSLQALVQHETVSTENIPLKLSATGFELVTMRSGFDLIDLSTLATYHVGRATAEALSSDPLQLLRLLDSKQWSYMSYLPSLYGSCPCLDDAINCLIARVREVIAPKGETGEREVIGLYLKAIDSLQKALNSSSQRLAANVLCATEILALYELFDPSGKERWMRHANGATDLIRLRGPDTYNTEFEKALFMAHSGPIMTESLLNNEKCFLAQPAWQAVFQSLIIPGPSEISDRSEIVVSLLILKSRVSALFAEITIPICNSHAQDPSQLHELALQADVLRNDILQWRASYEQLLASTLMPSVASVEYNKRCEVMSTYMSCSMISNRLLLAVSFRSADSTGLEDETQFLARQMLALEMQVRDVSPHTKLFLAQTISVANATIATLEEWVAGDEESGGVISKWKFERWCSLFGRKVS